MKPRNIENFSEIMAAVAVAVRDDMVPVGGIDDVVKPPTYAPSQGADGVPTGYQIDEFPDGGNRVVLDSTGSQANRMEAVYAPTGPYADLVARVTNMVGPTALDLTEHSHRLADALMLVNEQSERVEAIFDAAARGDLVPMAKSSPGSVVFGVMNLRGNGFKLHRMVSSAIYGWNVKVCKASAQFTASGFDAVKLFPEVNAVAKASKLGLAQVPDRGALGGVICERIDRRAVVNVAATLHVTARAAAENAEQAAAAREYVVALGLLAALAPQNPFLREGCTLVPRWRTTRLVTHADPMGEEVEITVETAERWAREAAARFGVGEGWTARFDPSKVAGADAAQKTRDSDREDRKTRGKVKK